MRNYIPQAALAAMMTLAPIASAATPAKPAATQAAVRDAKVHGVIKGVDMKTHTLTLDDGRTFALPANYAATGLKAGEKVKIDWAWSGDQRPAKEVTSGN